MKYCTGDRVSQTWFEWCVRSLRFGSCKPESCPNCKTYHAANEKVKKLLKSYIKRQYAGNDCFEREDVERGSRRA